MERVLEKLAFPREGLTFTVQALPVAPHGALLRERSKVKGRIDKRLLMVRTLELGIVEPAGTNVDTLMSEYPEVAMFLAVRIVELTTG